MDILNTVVLGLLVVLLALLSITSGMESRQNLAYPGQGYFAVLYAAGVVGLIMYKIKN